MLHKRDKSFLVVLPVFNEIENLKILLPRIWEIYPFLEILVIDDNSIDGTNEFIEELRSLSKPISYVNRPMKLGIGNAHLAGIAAGIHEEFQFIITMDADLTHRPEDLDGFMGRAQKSDLTIGSRYLDNSNMQGWSFFRKFLTRLGHSVTSIAFARNWDMSSGMRMYRADAIPLDLLRVNCPDDYAFFFTSALTYDRLNLTVDQVPIQLDKRRSGSSKMTMRLIYTGTKRLALYSLRIKRIKIDLGEHSPI